MAKAKECMLVCINVWGYHLTPRKCKSIREAVRYAKELGMAYRVFVDGKCVRNGWTKNY